MTLNSILVLILFFLVFVIIILALVYLSTVLKQKDNSNNKAKVKSVPNKKETSKVKQNYNVQSIFNFMEFERIEDNMIVQSKGKKYLMAIECQGINYDLMSEIEQNSVETGFMQFLNTLRKPIQIYTQSRTVNLEQSINRYKTMVKNIENSLREKEIKYRQLLDNPNATEKQINEQKMEIARQKNLYEYGQDIVANTEKMSFNKNVLQKKYYIIISYYYSDNGEDVYYDESEIREIAFSELYTNAQTIIRTLASTGVIGHVANSYELVDLLYNAYNKDEAETFGVNKAYMGGFDELYVTAQDVFEKKIQALDKKIEEDATKLAEKAILKAKTKLEKMAEKKEDNLDDLINELAKELIGENVDLLGDEMAQMSIENVDLVQKEKKEETKNAKKGRKKSK